MPARWTADLVADMHLYGITGKQLAASAGITTGYLSMILNGHRTPQGAEEALRAAVQRCKADRQAGAGDNNAVSKC